MEFFIFQKKLDDTKTFPQKINMHANIHLCAVTMSYAPNIYTAETFAHKQKPYSKELGCCSGMLTYIL